MDKILARGMVLRGCHGVLPREKEQAQKFIIDVEMLLDLQPAGTADDLRLTVDYSRVYQVVRAIVEEQSFSLIEALAENIAISLLAEFAVEEVAVTVAKPEAPVEGDFTDFAVQIRRRAVSDPD